MAASRAALARGGNLESRFSRWRDAALRNFGRSTKEHAFHPGMGVGGGSGMRHQPGSAADGRSKNMASFNGVKFPLWRLSGTSRQAVTSSATSVRRITWPEPAPGMPREHRQHHRSGDDIELPQAGALNGDAFKRKAVTYSPKCSLSRGETLHTALLA